MIWKPIASVSAMKISVPVFFADTYMTPGTASSRPARSRNFQPGDDPGCFMQAHRHPDHFLFSAGHPVRRWRVSLDMPGRRALKVFRTSAGFEDAYIAAPSQKAALDAWGAKRNLFAQGAAELVTDPELAKAALARPGEVLRVPRGTTADHVAAAASNRAGGSRRSSSTASKETMKRPDKPAHRPDRDKLDAARARLERRQRDLDVAEAELARQVEALRAEMAETKRRNKSELARLEHDVEAEEHRYRLALAAWQG